MAFRNVQQQGARQEPERTLRNVGHRCDLPPPCAGYSRAGLCARLWIYGPLLDKAFKVIEAWGFTFKSELLVCVKTTPSGKPRKRRSNWGRGFHRARPSG